jgi:hypothetical protein
MTPPQNVRSRVDFRFMIQLSTRFFAAFFVNDDARALSTASSTLAGFSIIKNQAAALSLESGPMYTQVSVASVNFSTQNVSAATVEGNMKYIPLLQQYTRSFYIPLVSMITRDAQVDACRLEIMILLLTQDGCLQQSQSSSAGQLETLASLQKKIREMDSLLDQVQAGAVVPSVHLVVEEVVINASKKANSQALRTLLEKWNISQVDALLNGNCEI